MTRQRRRSLLEQRNRGCGMLGLGNTKYYGLQSLGCAIVGIVFSTVLDSFGYEGIAVVAGMVLSATLMLVVVGWNYLTSKLVWIIIFALTTAHIVAGIYFFPYDGFKPIMLLPFALAEACGYLYLIDRLSGSR